MNKEQYIQAIESYVNDGYMPIPSGTRRDLAYNGIKLADIEETINISKETLDSLLSSNKLRIMPEGTLSTIKSYIETSRQHLENLASGELSKAEQALGVIYSHTEQIVALVSPFSNLVDNLNYKSLVKEATATIELLKTSISEEKKESAAIRKSIKVTETKSTSLLRRISSGVLSENFKNLSNSKWNYTLMALGLLISLGAFVCLVIKSNEINNYLIAAFEQGSLDYRIFIAKWSTLVPYLFLLSIGVLELRSRIRSRDIYAYRENVAGSLDGYTESLLNRVDDIKNPAERDRARAMVIEFMIDSMLELTKSPIDKKDKHSIGVKVKDVGEATISA